MSKELFIPMSSLQCAYMIERERGLKTTGTPCHVYMEFDTVSINETHLRKAWETLYVRHPMMRAKAEMCGLLKIEELNDREAERTIKIWEEDIFIKENMREILSHEKLDIRNGINCRLHLIKRHQKIVRLAFDLDLTMCDVLSFLIILRDLGEFYRYFKRGIIREYHSNEIEEEVLLSENRKSDKVYWEQRLRNSDIAFPLKVKGSIEELVKTKYISINRKMDKKVLDRLTLKLKISTEEILLIVFSYTVLKYTKKEQVLINFPFSNRTKERQNRVGDYTKSIIYRCDIKRGVAFELERRIPEYMIPSVITFLPRLPQTSNDKIDRGRISKWISASAEENKKVDVAELPQNDLEEQIARIWCKELNIERIGRNDNFYLSGGDSLLIAQVIARMRETIEAAKRWSWDDLLKEMMKTPTIRGVAKILSNQAGENEQDKSLVIIKEAAESSEKKVTVVFHAGTGTLTPYNSLIAYITERSQENEAVMGFTFGDEAEYLAIPTDKIFENLGKKYGRILSELGFTEYTLIGHCVGGLIALETAHYLKDKGKNVSSVTLLSTSIPHKKEETVLADLDMKIFETAVQTSLYNELLLERTFASLIDADIKKAGHQVDNDTLQQVIEYLIFNNGGNITVQALCSLTGKFAEVGAEFQRLHSMSATERMNDLYTTIERPNGQLMEHQRKMLNVLFRVFAQNFRCVSSYIPKVYTGKMRVFDCESAIANFFPSLFSEDKKTWEQYAQGEFLFDTMKGDHISCMNSPYIEENVKKILDL